MRTMKGEPLIAPVHAKHCCALTSTHHMALALDENSLMPVTMPAAVLHYSLADE